MKIAFALIIAGFLALVAAASAQAAGPNQGLDCVTCHGSKVTLAYHDKLGEGNKACWTCHDGIDMKSLRLSDGTQVARSEAPKVCGQCHQARFNAWIEGTHGVPGTVAAVGCTSCHNPHRPQMVFPEITKPHPEPAAPPPAPPKDAIMIVGITVVFMTGLAVVVSRQGKRP
ncbi:MAG: hypothetical protein HY673_07250 [Chloroflexi bacterium]|nr:hypothetical protein [Chloroflexota bacterium]